MTQFSSLGLAEPILRAVTEEGYTQPTPIQAKAIPALLEGRDVLGIAQTGTGKTAAFVLPLLHRLTAEAVTLKPRSTRAIILAPTRELASQIAESIRAYGRNLRLTVTVVVGGVKPGPQVKSFARGVDIVVATPGRLLDHFSNGSLSFGQVGVAVLDEADQMLDLGFIPDIRRIMAKLPKDRQTLLFSATMPPPIRALASDFLRDPLDIAVAPVARPAELIDQHVVMMEHGGNKRDALVTLLSKNDVERGIIFTRTKHGADKLCKQLVAAGHPALAIHGNKSQPQRERALASFKSGEVRLLIATDIAARGIDIDGVSHVFNYELPHVPESYVHRIGRTARAGASGVAYALCAPDERSQLRAIERLIGRAIPVKSGVNGAANQWSPVEREATSPRAGEERRGHRGRPGGGDGRGQRSETRRPRPQRDDRRDAQADDRRDARRDGQRDDQRDTRRHGGERFGDAPRAARGQGEQAFGHRAGRGGEHGGERPSRDGARSGQGRANHEPRHPEARHQGQRQGGPRHAEGRSGDARRGDGFTPRASGPGRNKADHGRPGQGRTEQGRERPAHRAGPKPNGARKRRPQYSGNGGRERS